MGTVKWDYMEQAICRLLGFIHISLAVAVIAGGSRRFPAPSYDSILNLTNGRAWPYGAAWLIGGLLMLAPGTVWRLAGTGTVTFISCLWASLFAITAWEIDTAAYTPVAAYGGYGLLNAVMFWTMLIRWWGRRNNEVQ